MKKAQKIAAKPPKADNAEINQANPRTADR